MQHPVVAVSVASVLTFTLHIEFVTGLAGRTYRRTTSAPRRSCDGGDAGEPLFLTPYLEGGRPDLAVNKSIVSNLINGVDVESYSGFITVDSTYNSNMFFWFFPSKKNPRQDPVLLWLQGGPGATSLFGLFTENGPLVAWADGSLGLRSVSWTSTYSVLYVDNPVGTGFSFTNNDDGYARNETMVAENLYRFLDQFFTAFKLYSKNDFYLTGESYAGKYIPAIGYYIHKKNSENDTTKINLKGMAIGDGFCDPANMLDYGSFLYEVGMIDENQRTYFDNNQHLTKTLISEKLFVQAFLAMDRLMDADFYPYPSYFNNVTGSKNYFNFRKSVEPESDMNFLTAIGRPEVRKSIHVGCLAFNQGDDVERFLLADVMDTVRQWIPDLLENYKVLFYNGQYDIIVAAPLTERFLFGLEWSRQIEYQNAKRYWWKINKTDEEVAGFVRRAGNVYQVVVRGAGHMVPEDQPERALDMLTRFINDSPYPWR